MIIHEIALRYTKALKNLCKDKEERSQRLNSLEYVSNLLENDSKVVKFFASPEITFAQKKNLLEKMIGDKKDPLLLSYFFLLLKRNRFKFLPEIYREFRKEIYAELGISEGFLFTAAPQDTETKQKLIDKLQKLYGVQLKLKDSVDPELIGGGVAMIANRRLDFSIKGKLQRLKKDLLKHS